VLIATIENAPDIGVKRFFPVLVAALVNGVQANDAGQLYCQCPAQAGTGAGDHGDFVGKY
jgi:hypothetical protein